MAKIIEMPDRCPTCEGEGWLMDKEGEPCPDCQNPEWLGGTGLRDGKLPKQASVRDEATRGADRRH